MAGQRATGSDRSLRLALLVAWVAASCGAERPPLPTSPPVPVGWATVVSGDLSLPLPPWLVPFDTRNAIFANEVVDPGGQGVQLMAEGPRTAEPQPVAGESMEGWLLRRIESPAAGQPTIRQVDLPAGGAIVIERLDEAGTEHAWRIAAYAIRTPFGVAFLQIDGPPDAWVGREAELARIPGLMMVGPGRPRVEGGVMNSRSPTRSQFVLVALFIAGTWAWGATLPIGSDLSYPPARLDAAYYERVVVFSLMLAAFAPVAWLVLRLASPSDGSRVAAWAVAIGSVTAAVGNLVEDGLGIGGAGALYGFGLLGVLFGLVGLIVALAAGRNAWLTGLMVLTLAGLISGAGDGPPIMPLVWFPVAAWVAVRGVPLSVMRSGQPRLPVGEAPAI